MLGMSLDILRTCASLVAGIQVSPWLSLLCILQNQCRVYVVQVEPDAICYAAAVAHVQGQSGTASHLRLRLRGDCGRSFMGLPSGTITLEGG